MLGTGSAVVKPEMATKIERLVEQKSDVFELATMITTGSRFGHLLCVCRVLMK